MTTTITLARQPHTRPEPVSDLAERLTRRLHAQVHVAGVRLWEGGAMHVTLHVVASAALVRIACAAEVGGDVEWVVTP